VKRNSRKRQWRIVAIFNKISNHSFVICLCTDSAKATKISKASASNRVQRNLEVSHPIGFGGGISPARMLIRMEIHAGFIV